MDTIQAKLSAIIGKKWQRLTKTRDVDEGLKKQIEKLMKEIK